MIGFVRVQQGDTGAVTFDFLVFFIKNHTCSRQIIGQPHCADVRVNDLVAVADIAVFQLMLSEICEDFAIGLFGVRATYQVTFPFWSSLYMAAFSVSVT